MKFILMPFSRSCGRVAAIPEYLRLYNPTLNRDLTRGAHPPGDS